MTDFTPRPTVYNGVKMRSRLEAAFAMWLDEWGFQWQYEPHAFGSGAGQYLPDFLVTGLHDGWTGEKVNTYIEVKHAEWFEKGGTTDRVALVEAYSALIAASEPDAIYLTAQPIAGPFTRWHTFQGEGRPICQARRVHIVSVYPVGNVVAEDFANDPWPDGYWKVDPDGA